MTPVTTAKGSFIFVKVPDSISKYWIHFDAVSNETKIANDSRNGWTTWQYILEKGVALDKYQIIATTKNITEEQAAEIVDFVNLQSDCPCDVCGFDVDCWRDYVNQSENDWLKYPMADRLKCAIQSLQSLIQSAGLDTTKTYLILKKQ